MPGSPIQPSPGICGSDNSSFPPHRSPPRSGAVREGIAGGDCGRFPARRRFVTSLKSQIAAAREPELLPGQGSAAVIMEMGCADAELAAAAALKCLFIVRGKEIKPSNRRAALGFRAQPRILGVGDTPWPQCHPCSRRVGGWVARPELGVPQTQPLGGQRGGRELLGSVGRCPQGSCQPGGDPLGCPGAPGGTSGCPGGPGHPKCTPQRSGTPQIHIPEVWHTLNLHPGGLGHPETAPWVSGASQIRTPEIWDTPNPYPGDLGYPESPAWRSGTP